MNDDILEEYLRENKPRTADNPTFLLEAGRRMQAVDGVKSEVDRSRSHGRLMLALALAAGVVMGSVATAMAFMFPVDSATVAGGLRESLRLYLSEWRPLLMAATAVCATALGIVLVRGRIRFDL